MTVNKIFLLINIFFVGVLLFSSANAATYYVSNSGNDVNNGLSESTPWKTLSKVNEFNLQPGDTVLLKSGDEWRETLSPSKSGSSSGHITYGAYGAGVKPKITGSNKISDWSVHSGNVWKVTVTTKPYWIATISSNGVVTWMTEVSSLSAVNSEREFYCSSTTCYLYSTADPDTAYSSVEGTYRNGIESSNNYIKFENLEIRLMTWEGIRGVNVDNWIIQNMEIHHVGDDQDIEGQGILYQGSNGLIRRNKIYETGQHGIYLALYNDEPRPIINNIIEYNEIFNQYHTGIDVMNLALDSSANDLHSNTTVRYNYVYQTPGHYGNQVGIQFQGSSTTNSWINDSKIYYNIVKDISSVGILSSWRNDNIVIYNNLVINCNSGNIAAVNPHNRRVIIKNNMIKQGIVGDYAIFVANISEKIVNNNLYYDQQAGNQFAYRTVAGSSVGYSTFAAWKTATGFDNESYNQDPLFINFNGGDYRLQSTSVAIDHGANVGILTDYDGVVIPQGTAQDIGAFEYVSGVTYHPADTDMNGCISIGEISNYVSLWLNENGVTLSQVSSAVSIWMQGC